MSENSFPARDPFQARQTLQTPLGERVIHRLDVLGEVDRLPYSIKVLLEACLRHQDGYTVTEDHVKALANYGPEVAGREEIPFKPGRVVLQDFTGVPAVVDLAAMRAGLARLTGREDQAGRVNPLVPCDLVIDHSVQVDAFGSRASLAINSEKEFERNRERYTFLKWGQKAMDNFRVVPPATGIVHQVNLEYLAKVVMDGADLGDASSTSGPPSLYPDSLVGTDSHTTMINGLGVVGWGVGGIEAEAVMLGQPVYMLVPEVVGLKLTGQLPEGATATDLVLRVTELLREHGVVGRFVEFHGEGLAGMPVANRATLANMAPEYGATMGFFPVDEQTLKYLELTGRPKPLIETVEQYCREQRMWRDDARHPAYIEDLHLDLDSIEPSLAGPRRPQDRITLSAMRGQWQQDLSLTFGKSSPARDSTAGQFVGEGGESALAAEGVAVAEEEPGQDGVPVTLDGRAVQIRHGDVVIAAITSCTNTSNPEVMLAAGLVARKAAARGLVARPWVKTSLAPGSKVVTEYLNGAGLMEALEKVGFYLVGYGCTTCIGNSGPLPEPISQAIREHDLVAASVLSGNRNFEGRINPDVKANYLASPPLVVAYALAGTVDVDLTHDPVGEDHDGKPVYLGDIWPSQQEVQRVVEQAVSREQFLEQYANVFEGSDQWRSVETTGGALYQWDEDSTYIQEPPFFEGLCSVPRPIRSIRNARCLVKVADSVTTDHISPAGAIKKDSPAGRYLSQHGVPVAMFNSYGSRRGNHQIMMRGTFANVRVRNQLAPGTEGGWTTYFGPASDKPRAEVRSAGAGGTSAGQPETETLEPGTVTDIYNAAMHYQQQGVDLVVLAGRDYGMGSSRDWAAKGTQLLGVKAVLAVSFERIHRSNLVGMGVLPLEFPAGESAESLGLDGTESFDIDIPTDLTPRQTLLVTAHRADGGSMEINAICRIDTPVEVDYYRHGGILHTVLRRLAEGGE